MTIFDDGTITRGAYDGYGRYEDESGNITAETALDGTVWHDSCWRAAGSPTGYRGVSEASEDQGYFFDDPAHDLPEPTASVDDKAPDEVSLAHPVVTGIVNQINKRLYALPDKYSAANHGAARALADLRADIITTFKGDTAEDPSAEASDPSHVAALQTALGFLIATRDGQPVCENSTNGIGACFAVSERTADARYGADKACASCVAHYALTGQPIPTGPGKIAEEEADLPLCMQPGWDPETPGRESEARFLEACIAEGVDPRDLDRHPDDFDDDVRY